MQKLLLCCMMLVVHLASAQEGFPVNGVMDKRPGLYAFTNATVYVDYQTKLENATLLIADGKVLAVGRNVEVPKGAITVDLDGKFIYPAVVEPYATFGLPEVKSASGGRNGKPQYFSEMDGPKGWNEAIKSTYHAVDDFRMDLPAAREMKKAGIGAALVFQPDGIMRGTSLFTTLSDKPIQEAILSEKAAAHWSFDKGSSGQEYPSSIMGAVALIRQTYYDAQWYAASANRNQINLTLQALNDTRDLPQVFEANGDKLRVLLVDKIADEFGIPYIIKGNGDEYQRLAEIKAMGQKLIVPVNFPEAYDVSDPIATLDVSLAEMKHWELAPANARMLSEAGVEFAFTSHGLKDPDDYWANLRKAVKYGLSESAALKALTQTPAAYYRMENEVGALKKGMQANFFISSDHIFHEKATIMQTWVQGQKYEVKELNPEDLSGKYNLTVGDQSYTMEISGEPGSHSAKLVISDTTDIVATLKLKNHQVTITFTPQGAEGDVRLTGWTEGESLAGNGQTEAGDWVQWIAEKTGDPEEEEETEEQEEGPLVLGEVIYPFVAYGWDEEPTPETILFQNATVWTLTGEGKIEGADVLVKDGKIAAVGKNLTAPEARVVNATGKHVTPGIIDEHSHIALSGVNEGTHAITAEVRMYDAVDSEDINIYRQLAGGVTSSQLLHGSANPVGGQSALIKLRWGRAPEDLKIAGADGFIKFALGENVKQSNWGDDYTVRFPQSRMGVEQVFAEGFSRAREYEAAKAKYEALSRREKASTPPPRKNLQLETLLEILNRERFITCHSYVQSEINMLINVARQFDFQVNTFTHILEGYKVADLMAEHGAGGSTFGDWWFYKFEVNHAIPYNASLMHMAGVTVAINSDDAEMARRLNQEAAKSVKYGGMSEMDALKMVTLNPAKLLHLDHRMGSLEPGKDADVVLWSDHPLAIYARAEMTLVDGIVYYSLEKDEALKRKIDAERMRLINKMRSAKENGEKTQTPSKSEKHNFHCDDIITEGFITNDHSHE